MTKKNDVMTFVTTRLEKDDFIHHHKYHKNDFTRNRILTFSMVFLLLLKKSIKSLQLMLNELFIHHIFSQVVSASAYTQARKKFKHTAFIELNEGAMAIFYGDDAMKRWKGYRIFGVDGSKIILPSTPDIEQEFGRVTIKNQHMEGRYVCGLFECRYDVLNHLAVQSVLAPGASYEVNLAVSLLHQSIGSSYHQKHDLDIYDRGYASFEFLSHLVANQRAFVVRLASRSFKKQTESLFLGQGPWRKTVILAAPADKKTMLKAQGLPLELTRQLVSVVLDTGEIEVLATSLNEPTIRRQDFKELYDLRWGVECFFNVLKGRLNLENFTGKSLESVKQDRWSTVFITTLETIFTTDTQETLDQPCSATTLPKKINKAVSFNVIKNMAFDIFFNQKNRVIIEEKLDTLFKTNTIVQRHDRSPPRKKISVRRSANYQKRQRKHVF